MDGIRLETKVTLDQSHLTPIGYRACLVCAIRLTGLATVFTALSCSARAVDGSTSDPGIPDKSGYTLLNPTPDDEIRKFTPDRPAKGFSVRFGNDDGPVGLAIIPYVELPSSAPVISNGIV
jgi:hypothetical protein